MLPPMILSGPTKQTELTQLTERNSRRGQYVDTPFFLSFKINEIRPRKKHLVISTLKNRCIYLIYNIFIIINQYF